VNRARFLWSLGIAGLLLPAAAAAPQERKARFVVMPKQGDNPVFNYARIGAIEKARELGVKVIWSAPVSNDEAKQADLLRSFIAQKVDGIAVSCTNAEILSGPINVAVAAGIPVTTWDSDSPNSKRAAFCGLDNYQAGQIIACELGELLWRLHRGEKITEAKDGWFVDSGVDMVVLDPKKFPHPERYISLADYKKMFESRLKTAK